MRYYLSILLAVSFIAANAQEKFSVNKATTFNRKNAITVINKDKYDPADLGGKLENLLLNKEFDVISEEVALSKSKSKTKYNDKGEERENYNAVEIKSVYAFKYRYRVVEIPPNWMWQKAKIMITEMSGNIIDLANDGKLVATFTYSNNSRSWAKAKPVDDILESLFDKLLNK